MTDTRIANIVAELRAQELLRALRHAVAGTGHWRLEAENLLMLIDGGVMPPRKPPHHQEAA